MESSPVSRRAQLPRALRRPRSGRGRSYDPPVPGWLFAVIVAVFVVVAVVVIRRTQRGAFVTRLPLAEGEHVLLEEEGLKLFHRFRRTSVSGGGTVTHRVRSMLTDRRIFLATGGPEGKHKFVILMILDYTTDAGPFPRRATRRTSGSSGSGTATRPIPARRATWASRRTMARRASASSSRSPRPARDGAIRPRCGCRRRRRLATRRRSVAPCTSGVRSRRTRSIMGGMPMPLTPRRVVAAALVAACAAASGASARGLPPFGTGAQKLPATGKARQPEISRLSVECHRTYDRLVIRSRDGTPNTDVRYVARIHEDASGRLIPLLGTARLQVTLQIARAHTLGGRTLLPAVLTPRCPSLRQVKLAGDFEGYVSLGLGLATRTGFRIFQTAPPRRIVVDVAH